MKKFLKEIFTDQNGKISSKRVFGSIGFLAAVIAICNGVDNQSMRTLLITGAGMIGAGIFEDKFKLKK